VKKFSDYRQYRRVLGDFLPADFGQVARDWCRSDDYDLERNATASPTGRNSSRGGGNAGRPSGIERA
jgi:hypothetical protein